ncbi:hypothetical protein N7467_008695 [Penicillium canescens]|nr:hypothetical protein N7467_008695 [Penicillium canescens]
MFTSTIITSLILGLTQLPSSYALPSNRSNQKGLHNQPRRIGLLPARTERPKRLRRGPLNPHGGASDEDKARMLTEAAYTKKYDDNDVDMSNDVQALLAHVAGNSTSAIEKRSSFVTSAAHAVIWEPCKGFFACIAGETCTFDQDIGKAPRSHCESHGGSNCCISWSTYNVRAGFFATTWTTCNEEVKAEGKTSASCEGYGSSDQGGDVCLSNRASGCT